MYEKLKQLIYDLDARGIQPYIGYGNPDADILIVGKECALTEDSEAWKLFYKSNFAQWKQSFEGHGFGYNSNRDAYSFEHGNFHPIFPFFEQRNKILRPGKIGEGTSSTYYYYQRLVDMVRSGRTQFTKSPNIDFFKDCFITELNDICRPNDKGLKKDQHLEIREHIKVRFDWMRATNFFNSFKVVILACGPYSKAIKEMDDLRKELFGDALIIYCNQLSRWDKSLDDRISEIHNHLKQNR
ncbi:MAG: hypothetical protein K6F33_05200 [Bacteroidales bacterium]|nr:hypothetical protein [Bacteroidales bacterium]